jgi:1,2-diacylglycerol 3-alpha-glucosyltransferase
VHRHGRDELRRHQLIARHVLHGQIRRRLLDRWHPFLDKLYAAVPITANFLEEVYGVPRADMELLPLCADVDLADAIRSSDARREIRRELGFRDDQMVVFTGGKFADLKQTHMAVEAVQLVRDENVGLVLVGDAERGHEAYRDMLHRIAAGNPNIHFMGWRKAAEVYRYMGACDVALFPAGQSVLWQQALSMGLPLVVGRATWRGDQDPSYLNRNDNMVIIPRAEITSENIAEHLRGLARDPQRLARMRDGALRVTDEFLNYNRIVDKTFVDTGLA